MQLGEAQKRRAATAMNDRSTRAHSIFILTLKQRMHHSVADVSSSKARAGVEVVGETDEDAHRITTITSKLFLADLGGSEQVKKSKVNGGGSKKYPARGESDVANNEEELKQEEEEEGGAGGAVFSTGFEMAERMREAVYINLGLLALKKCIEALNAKSSYVPFQVRECCNWM